MNRNSRGRYASPRYGAVSQGQPYVSRLDADTARIPLMAFFCRGRRSHRRSHATADICRGERGFFILIVPPSVIMCSSARRCRRGLRQHVHFINHQTQCRCVGNCSFAESGEVGHMTLELNANRRGRGRRPYIKTFTLVLPLLSFFG